MNKQQCIEAFNKMENDRKWCEGKDYPLLCDLIVEGNVHELIEVFRFLFNPNNRNIVWFSFNLDNKYEPIENQIAHRHFALNLFYEIVMSEKLYIEKNRIEFMKVEEE